MCRIYAATDPRAYRPVRRSVRLGGMVTSIRLEARFWEILDAIAAEEGMSTARFLTVLHDEVLELRGKVENFASLLRVVCTTWLARRGGFGDPVSGRAAAEA